MNNQAFEDKRIAFEDWPAMKPTTPNGTLPIFEVNGQTWTQSGAADRYFGQHFDMYPKDLLERFACDEVLGMVDDLGRMGSYAYVITKRPESMGHFDKSPEELKALEQKMRKTLMEGSFQAAINVLDEK